MASCGTSCSAPADGDNVISSVKEYYGKVLSTNQDLKTNACTLNRKSIPKHIREALSLINEEVSSKYYGCGLVAPELLEGCRVLDLGSGSGQDCFVLSKLVGQKGHVTGLDMTDEQLDVAKENIQYHTDVFGYSEPNVDFVKGYIEKLGEAGLQDNTFDVIISNCVVNLSPDKKSVLTEAHRVLKTGGELYFSDVYADRELSEDIRKHEVLWGECISGALHWETLVRLAAQIGFSQPRLVMSSVMEIGNEELQKVVGDAQFVSATYRLFKLPEKRSKRRQVIYEGGVLGCEDVLELDHHTKFPKGDAVSVDDQVSSILEASRFKDEFTFEPPSQCCQPCPPSQTKDEVDPFLLAASSGKPSSDGGCCGPKNPSKCC